jgi:hypothetical protein
MELLYPNASEGNLELLNKAIMPTYHCAHPGMGLLAKGNPHSELFTLLSFLPFSSDFSGSVLDQPVSLFLGWTKDAQLVVCRVALGHCLSLLGQCFPNAVKYPPFQPRAVNQAASKLQTLSPQRSRDWTSWFNVTRFSRGFYLNKWSEISERVRKNLGQGDQSSPHPSSQNT